MAKAVKTPKTGDHIEWVKGVKNPKVIRVHAMGAEAPVTLCKALNTATSRYLKENHFVFVTTKALTCKPCIALAAKAKPKAVRKARAPKVVVVLEQNAEQAVA